MVAKTAFHAMHAGFREAATMVTDTLLPLPPSTAADLANRHVPGQRAAFRIAVLLDLRVALGRNDRLGPAFFQVDVHLPLVVSAVAIELIRSTGHLIQQGRGLAGVVATVLGERFRHNLLGLRIDGQVQLPPRADPHRPSGSTL